MNIQEIPLTPTNQQFAITLGEQQLNMRVMWRDEAGWLLDLMDGAGAELVNSIPLVPGANLLEQYAHLGLKGALAVLVDNNEPELPTKTNLGIGSHLYYVQE
ncbi:phage baseplate plug family protein [Serratia marcescens]|uniref:phage baseplate plug family protein n=1 Tax=Serratia marcescens TaxID=615 RepID=UPI003204785C